MNNRGQSYITRENRPPINVPEITAEHKIVMYVEPTPDGYGNVHAIYDTRNGETHTHGGLREFRRKWEAVHAEVSIHRPDILDVYLIRRRDEPR